MEFFGVSSCQEDNKSAFEKKMPLFWPQKVHFPQTSPVCWKNWGFFPRKKLHILFASLQLWQSWRNGQLMKAHSSKTKRHTQHRKRHLEKNINNISLKSIPPKGSCWACCMHFACTSLCWGDILPSKFLHHVSSQILAPWSPSKPTGFFRWSKVIQGARVFVRHWWQCWWSSRWASERWRVEGVFVKFSWKIDVWVPDLQI